LGDIVAETATDSAGAFKMEDVPVGSYRLFTVADPRFRYMCRSADECAGIRDGYRISLSEGLTQLNVGLMEGFLTLPFQRNEFRMKSYVDLDPALGVRDWRGGRDTYDGHPGTDFLANEAIDILATAPGTIFAAASGWPDNQNWTSIDYYRNNGNFVIVDHGNGLYIAYHHLKSIAVNETLWSSAGPSISRGQVIGQVGATGVTAAGGTERISVPHLHLQVWNGSGFMHGRVDALDPYRDLHYDKHGPSPWANNASLWSKDNDPQYSVP
jgi:murein DD-endopeptidase MepM/ murein hydrolase activator NlpD